MLSMRLLILLLLLYLGYRSLKKWLLGNMYRDPSENNEGSLTAVDDIMVKDPFCNTYFPKRSGIHMRYKGKDLYFCKLECRDGFLSAQENNNLEKDK